MNKTKEVLKNLIQTVFDRKGGSYRTMIYNYDKEKWEYAKLGQDETDIVQAASKYLINNDNLDNILNIKSDIILDNKQYNFTLIKTSLDNYIIGYYDNLYNIWLCKFEGGLENTMKELKKYINSI